MPSLPPGEWQSWYWNVALIPPSFRVRGRKRDPHVLSGAKAQLLPEKCFYDALWQCFKKNDPLNHCPGAASAFIVNAAPWGKLTPVPQACSCETICSCFPWTSYPNKRLSQKPTPKTAQRPHPSQACPSQWEEMSGVSVSAPLGPLPQEPPPVGTSAVSGLLLPWPAGHWNIHLFPRTKVHV